MAACLIITRGLPASGKSTWAREFKEMHDDLKPNVPCRIVTLDDIREAIGSQFEAGDESIAQSVRDFTIREYLRKGYTVISADTNLAPYTFGRVRGVAEKLTAQDNIPVMIEVKDFTDVPLETCLARNKTRWVQGDTKVPDQAIVKMHEQYLSNTPEGG